MNFLKKFLSSLILISMLMALFLSFGTPSVSAAAAEPTCQQQYSDPYYVVKYGNDTIANSACGIFAFSNTVHYLTGNRPEILPVVEWAYNAGHYTSTYGTNQAFYSDIQAKYGSTYGFTVTNLGQSWSSTTLKNHLANGGTAVMNVPNHYIAVVGYDNSTGKFHIYDSANDYRRGTAGSGNVWLTEAQINSYYNDDPYNVIGGLTPTSGCWLFTRTGSAPAWYANSGNLGSVFYARIKNVNGSTVYMSMNDDNKSITGKALNTGSSNQIWKFTLQGDGSYEIENLASFLRLDVDGNSAENGTKVHLYKDTDGANQRWKLVAQGDGYNLVPNHATGSALDCSTNSKNAQIWTKSDGDAQRFYIEKVSAAKLPSVDLGTEFYATMSNTAGGNTVYFTNMEGTADVAVKGQAKTQAENQIWRFHKQSGDGSYEISSAVNGQNMTVGATADGTKITLTADNNSTNQRWFIYKQGDGYRLESQYASNAALDCSASAKNAQIWENAWGGENQTFFINYISYDKLDSNFTATIQNKNNSKYLTANSDGSVNSQASNSSSTQQWSFERQNDGSYKIKNVSDGKYLELTDSAIVNGTVVKHASAADADRQKWYVYKYANNYYRIIPKLAHNSALDVDSNANKVQIYQQSGGEAQWYTLAIVGGGHTHTNTYNYQTNNNGTHIKTYKCCGGVVNAKEACSGGTASCTESKVCQYCKAAYGNTAAHSYTLTKTDEAYHWKQCNTCTATTDKTVHSYDDANDTVCNDNCGYTRTITPTETVTPDTTDENTPNENNISSETENDDTDGCGSAVSGAAVVLAFVTVLGTGISFKRR